MYITADITVETRVIQVVISKSKPVGKADCTPSGEARKLSSAETLGTQLSLHMYVIALLNNSSLYGISYRMTSHPPVTVNATTIPTPGSRYVTTSSHSSDRLVTFNR